MADKFSGLSKLAKMLRTKGAASETYKNLPEFLEKLKPRGEIPPMPEALRLEKMLRQNPGMSEDVARFKIAGNVDEKIAKADTLGNLGINKLNAADEWAAKQRDLGVSDKLYTELDKPKLTAGLDEGTTKKVAGIVAAALGAGALGSEEAEAGVPGSRAAREAIKETPGLAQKFSSWILGAERPARQAIADIELPKEARLEMLRRLTPKTQIRRNPETNEVEYLLHRGGAGYTGPETRSWTTSPDVAEGFAVTNAKDNIQSAWVPAKQIKNYPNMFGGTDEKVSGSKFIKGPSSLKHEEEVLASVHPENIKETRRLEKEKLGLDDKEIDDFFKGHTAAGVGAAALGAKSAEASPFQNPYEGFPKDSLFYKDIPEHLQRQESEESFDPLDIPITPVGAAKTGAKGFSKLLKYLK